MSGAKPLTSFDLSSFRYDPLRSGTKGTTQTRLKSSNGDLDVKVLALTKVQSSQPISQPHPLIYTLPDK